MTEQEAKTKDCCGPDGCGDVIDTDPTSDWRLATTQRVCRGSRCMAWRWTRVTSRDPVAAALADMVDDGYCGLAGPTT